MKNITLCISDNIYQLCFIEKAQSPFFKNLVVSSYYVNVVFNNLSFC